MQCVLIEEEKYKFNVIYGKIWVQNTLEMSKALFSKYDEERKSLAYNEKWWW